ncbi:hypothetical protein VYM41_003596 [Escherichia coli]|nr:hypothetical protein [Escherichia coli]
MQHKRSANDGISLAAIVAKETKKGTWSGTGGGVGLGFGGPGVFLGGMSGSKSEQTKRASDFEAPAETAFNWNYVLAPFYVMVTIAVLIKLAGGAVEIFHDTGVSLSPGPGDAPNPLSKVSDLTSTWLSALVYIVPILLVIGVGIYFFFFAGKRTKQEEERYLTEKQLDNAKELIYYRLRYIEQDHIVFDPVSGDEVPATKKHIHQLLHRLALDRVKRDNSR